MTKAKFKIIDKKSKYFGKVGKLLIILGGMYTLELPDKEIFQYQKKQLMAVAS